MAEQNMIKFEDVSRHQRRIAASQPWNVFPLFAYDTTNDANCASMPHLYKILKQIPSVKLAMLSVISGGAQIPTHCGFYKGVLRVHLTLHTDTPTTEAGEAQRYIEVGKQTYAWKDGQMVAFDDTFPHKVINNIPGRRVVLFLDVDRPTGSQLEKTLLQCAHWLVMQSPAVKELAAIQELKT
jgi:beta-hydroxylase